MPVLVKVPLVVADQVSANGNIYPRQLLERVARQLNPAQTMAFVHDKGLQLLENVVGQVTHLQLAENGKLYGTIKLVDTPRGLDVQELWLNDYRPKFSMAGRGTVEGGVVQDDFHLDSIMVDIGSNDGDAKLRKILRMKQRKHYEVGRPAEDHRSTPGNV